MKIKMPIYLLTYSMVQSPSWEANWFAASQEIPRISRNPKVHYRNHKRPPAVSILGQPNPVHIPTSHLLEIHPNIIHPSTPRSPQWSPSLLFPHQDPIHPMYLINARKLEHIKINVTNLTLGEPVLGTVFIMASFTCVHSPVEFILKYCKRQKSDTSYLCFTFFCYFLL